MTDVRHLEEQQRQPSESRRAPAPLRLKYRMCRACAHCTSPEGFFKGFYL